MANHSFTVELAPESFTIHDDSGNLIQNSFDALADLIYCCGCDDGTFGVRNNKMYISFDREANTFEDAVESVKDQLLSIDVYVVNVTKD